MITIIAMLIALLLPAVQSTREAARSCQCSNNLKQVGLGLHEYANTHQTFPSGSYSGPAAPVNLTGSNWRAAMLPYLEQEAIYARLNFTGGVLSGCTHYGHTGYTGGNEILQGLRVQVFKCPSSPLDPFNNAPGSLNDLPSLMHDYIGISGAWPDPAGRAGVCKQFAYGTMCATGLLVPNELRAIERATDGTSNTLIVAEQSSTVGGADIRSNYGGGWCGVALAYTVASMPAGRAFHYTGLTTVVWSINYQTAVANSSSQTYDTNTILNSAHPGMIQGLLADGSVRGLSQTIEMETLRRLCVADDGQPVGTY